MTNLALGLLPETPTPDPAPRAGNFLLCRLSSAAALDNRHAWCFPLPTGNRRSSPWAFGTPRGLKICRTIW
ncbi:MAG: hypothetical protein V9G20_00005 [Candidatus Promineifilaceae bacterium]